VIGEAIYALAGADKGPLPQDKVVVLRLDDGSHEIAYAIERILDTAAIGGEIVGAAAPGEIEGTTLIGGEAVEVIDSFWLFAQHARTPRALAPLVCRLPAGDGWARAILAPLVEAAGYRVVGDDYDGEADVAFAGHAEAPPRAAEVITLHPDPESAAAGGGIYRYDRAALTAALAAARMRKSA
jgi:two-component system chemotaxis sensor kinase CheA